jgi:hypothetical protein
MNAEKIAVIIRDPENYWEGMRSSLGLGIEMLETHTFVLGEVDMPEDKVEGFKENLEFLKDELEGQHFTDSQANVEKWGFFEHVPLEDMAKKLSEYDLVIPF